MNSPTGLPKMKVQAHKVDVLELSTDTLTSDIERFFSAQGVDITRNTSGELLFVEMDGVVYHTGKAYAKSPDGSIKEYTGYSYKEEFPMFMDHLVHPKLLERIAKHLGACVCPQSIEIAIGRWTLKKLEQYDKWSDRTEED